jgi:hypothetical protein
MPQQNYKNHSRLVPLFHYVFFGLLLLTLIGAVVNLVRAESSNLYSASLILALTVCGLLGFIFIRLFPLRAQDRAIRAEENFRHYLLTGKPLDAQLTMPQIVALRFASDEELPALARRAVAEQLSNKAIKQAIQHWRADHHRV